MGADLFIIYFIIDEGREPDWAAAESALRAKDEIELKSLAALLQDFDPDIDDADSARRRLEKAIAAVRAAYDGDCRDAVELRHRGQRLLMTGGLSTGDTPTDSFDEFYIFEFAGLAAAAGFTLAPGD